ncbi:hypothetical protein D3C80_1335560 [compost metagenome]
MRRAIERKRHADLGHIGRNNRASLQRAVSPCVNANHLVQRHGCSDLDRRHLATAAVEMGTRPFYRHQRITHHRIMNDTGDRLALDRDGQQRTEGCKAGCKIESAIHWIDHEGQLGMGQCWHDGWISVIGFLAHNMGIRIKPSDSGSNALFRFNICFGDQIDR